MVCPEVNKFEQVSSHDHQMSLAGVGIWRGNGWYVQRRGGYVQGEGVHIGGVSPYHVTYPMIYEMFPITPLPVDRQKPLPSHNYCGGR